MSQAFVESQKFLNSQQSPNSYNPSEQNDYQSYEPNSYNPYMNSRQTVEKREEHEF